MRSLSIKKPLPRDSFSPRESKVSIATAEGFMRRTSSGRRSCPFDGTTPMVIERTNRTAETVERCFMLCQYSNLTSELGCSQYHLAGVRYALACRDATNQGLSS